MAAAQPLDPPLVLRLELVVELLDDPLAQLRGERLRVEAGREPLDQRQQQHRVAQVGLDRLGDPRVLDLDDDIVAVERRRSVDLADRRRRERTLVELGEDAAERSAELVSHQPLELRERDRRDVVAELGELRLQRVALVLGEAVELDHREHLPDLHRRATHLPELLDELVDERGGALVLRGCGALRRADAIGRPHARPPHTLAGHEPADPGGPRDPPGRQLSRFGRRFLGFGGHLTRQSSRRAHRTPERALVHRLEPDL